MPVERPLGDSPKGQNMHKLKHKLIWIGLGTLALLLRMGLAGRPDLIEQYYSRGLFLLLRQSIDALFGWLPIPLLYLFVPFLLWRVGRGIGRWHRRAYRHWRLKAGDAALGILAFLGGVVFLFLFLWGFNYGRMPLEAQLGLEIQPLALAELKEELAHETPLLIRLRQAVSGAGEKALGPEALPRGLERQLRQDLEHFLAEQGYPTVGRMRAYLIWPRGIFLRFGSAGLYFPWTGQGQVDAGLHPLQKPYVMAHELAHGYGFGDEGTCNFLAFLSASQSADPFIAYAARLGYWRTLAANYRLYEPELYLEFRQSLPPGIQADLDAINETMLRYPDFFPYLRYAAYDAYLRAQGIEEGMLNYDRVIMMARSWRLKAAGQLEGFVPAEHER